MKKPTSKKCQSRSKWTWKSTSFPVRKGFMACCDSSARFYPEQGKIHTDKKTVATRAQKKLLHIVLTGNLVVISCTRVNQLPSCSEGERANLEREENSANRAAKGNSHASSRSSSHDLPHLDCCGSQRRSVGEMRRRPALASIEPRKVARHDVPYRARDMYRWALLSHR